MESTFWAKLHIGSKEARYVCDSLDELKKLLLAWSDIRGEKIEIKDEEVIELWD